MHVIKMVLVKVFAQSADQELFLHDTRIDRLVENVAIQFLIVSKFFF